MYDYPKKGLTDSSHLAGTALRQTASPPLPEEQGRKARASSPWGALVFSFPVMLSFALAVLMFATAHDRFSDPDMWWHLKVGESIWNTRSIPKTDQYSYTTNQHAWIAHEWLAELSMYAAYRAGGYVGLWLWFAVVGSLFCIALYALCSIYSGNAKVSLLGGMVGWFFGTVSLALRPLLLGHLFLVFELVLIQLGQTRDRRWFWGLPPLYMVWVNCHGSHFLGLGVMALLLFCSLLEFRVGSLEARRWERSAQMTLAAVLPLSVAALFVNPIGWRLATYPLNLLLKQEHNLAFISEWSPLPLDGNWGVGLCVASAALGLIILLRRAVIQFQEAVLLLLGLYLGVRHTRMVFIFGILIAPPLCRLLSDLWEKWTPRRDHPIANAVMILAALAIIVVLVPRSAEIERRIKEANPAGAVEFIRKSGLSGPMMNDYVFGGYLIWALPEHKVFADGRADLFVWTGVFMDYLLWSNLRQDPKIVLDKYGINFCLLSKDSAMIPVLPYLAGWKKVYSDEISVVFAKI